MVFMFVIGVSYPSGKKFFVSNLRNFLSFYKNHSGEKIFYDYTQLFLSYKPEYNPNYPKPKL